MKKDNKGFSLVELIIVIAIMAILVGIVGSQVLPYLNKSREAKDQQILSGWVTAALSAYSANAATCVDDTYTIDMHVSSGKCTADATVTSSGSHGVTELQDSFRQLSASNGTEFSSTLYKTISACTIKVTPTAAGGNNVVVIDTLTYNTAKGSISTVELVAK